MACWKRVSRLLNPTTLLAYGQDRERTYVSSEAVIFVDKIQSIVNVGLDGRSLQVDSCRLLVGAILANPGFDGRHGIVRWLVLLGRKRVELVKGTRRSLGLGNGLLW